MMKYIISILISVFTSGILSSQSNIRTFIFGHSLIHHEVQVNPTPSQETSIPHWFHFLTEAGGHEFAVSGQYGFLPQHANVPPIAQWGFDVVEGAWDSDNEPFSEADFNSILITPGNFIQWQGPAVNYPSENISPVSATNTVFNWCIEQEEELVFYIYENWPEMAPFLTNEFPPEPNEWQAYNEYLNGDFHDWFVEYHQLIKEDFPDVCISMIPVGPIISKLLNDEPFNAIPIDELYEDDAPHGRATTYFLASLITYMATLEEKASTDIIVDPIIHQIIQNNYTDVVDFIWYELQTYVNEEGGSSVFCNTPTVSTSDVYRKAYEFTLVPNPVKDILFVNGISKDFVIDIYNASGEILCKDYIVSDGSDYISTSSFTPGIYTVVAQSLDGREYQSRRFLKW